MWFYLYLCVLFFFFVVFFLYQAKSYNSRFSFIGREWRNEKQLFALNKILGNRIKRREKKVFLLPFCVTIFFFFYFCVIWGRNIHADRKCDLLCVKDEDFLKVALNFRCLEDFFWGSFHFKYLQKNLDFSIQNFCIFSWAFDRFVFKFENLYSWKIPSTTMKFPKVN